MLKCLTYFSQNANVIPYPSENTLNKYTKQNYNPRNESFGGFLFINDEIVLNYSGITFDWKGNYTGSHIRIGPYRDSDPLGVGYPRQSIHYDDFIVVSDKKTLDKYLN